MAKRCGFVALLGAPNAGKSTLLNQLTGRKLSIVSAKPQTTRRRVLGIVQHKKSQILFVDLPGVFAPRRALDKAMVAAAWEGASGADIVIVLIDAARKKPAKETERVLKWLKEENRKAILALNKIDAMPKEALLAQAKEYFDTGLFTDVLMISAATGDGCDKLLDMAAKVVPEGPWQYPDDAVTDLPEREWAAEITREQAFIQLRQELPYVVAVETEKWKKTGKKSLRIEQSLYVAETKQRAIVLGEKGARIKAIGQAARAEMGRELELDVSLFLDVKVRENWMEDRAFLLRHGLESKG